MHNRFEAPARVIICEDDAAEFLAVETPIGRENLTKTGKDLLEPRRTGFNDGTRNVIGIHDLDAELAHAPSHGALARSHAPR